MAYLGNAKAGQESDGNNFSTFNATSSTTTTVATTSGSFIVTSGALFSTAHVGKGISGTGIPANAIITQFISPSSVVFHTPPTTTYPHGQPATATGSITATLQEGFAGAYTLTREPGAVRQLVVVALVTGDGTAHPSDLGGTFAFQYSEDGSSASITEVRAIANFDSVRDFDLINAGAYFRVMFAPSRDVTANETITLATTLRYDFDGQFVRLANQQIEETNAAMPQTFSYLKAFVKESATSINVRANKGEALLVSSFEAEVALGNITGYSSATKFGRVRNIDALDNAVDVWAFADDTASPRADTKTFPGAASTIYITSSSTSDTAVTVAVEYIDATGAGVTVTGVALNGQTPVSIGATGLDVNRLRVDGATAAVGSIYATVGNDFTSGAPNDVTDVLAVAPAGYQQSQLAHFTVPLGKTLLMDSILATVSRASGAAGSADLTLRIKEFGGVSRVRREYFPTTAVPIDNGIHNLTVPARGQIVWRVDDVSDGDTNVSVTWSYTLVDD